MSEAAPRIDLHSMEHEAIRVRSLNDAGPMVLADMRWPLHTGIGQVQEAYLARKPQQITLVDLKVAGSIGSPLSPARITFAIWRANKKSALFWSAGFVPPLFECKRAIVFVHDLTHLKYYGRLRRIYYTHILRWLYHRCAAIICVSDYTRREFLAWSKVDPEKVHVVKNGVSSAFLENKSASRFSYKYILYPGNHRPYKNLERLVRAFGKSNIASQGIHLLLTGEKYAGLHEVICECDLREFVHFCGRVPQDELPKLYRGAEAVVFVSLYEGFGLPILEAMASDVPVITSSVSAMPEVAGDAAVLVDPNSVDSIANALLRVMTDEKLRRELVAKGRRRVQEFDWDRSAEKFWQLVLTLSRSVEKKVPPTSCGVCVARARIGTTVPLKPGSQR